MGGYGTLTWPDGLEYQGFFRNNQPYDGKWLKNEAVIYSGGFRMLPDSGLFAFHEQRGD